MNKKNNVFYLTISSLISALACITLYLVAVVPTGRIALLCLCTAFQCVILIECGRMWSAMSGIICSLFILLFGTNKFISAAYVCMLAFYPVLKSVFESMRNRIVEWTCKCIYFILTLLAASLVLKAINLSVSFPVYIYITAIAAAIIFDIALSLFISYYMEKILPITSKIKKKNI